MNDSENVAKPRRWLWIALPIGCLTIFAIACGGVLFSVVFGVTALIKSSEPYVFALQEVSANPAAQQALGTPIESGMFVTGSINLSGDAGDADFRIPVSGPKGSGSVHVIGTKTDGEWTYSTLTVTLDNQARDRVDLLDKSD